MQDTTLERVYADMKVQTITSAASYTVYRIEDGRGYGTMVCHHLLPGIDLIFNEFHMSSCFRPDFPSYNVLEINHCQKGGYACEFCDGTHLIMGEGDLAVNRLSGIKAMDSYFPGKDYKGLCIIIDIDRASCSLKAFPQDVQVDLASFVARLCPAGNCFCSHASAGIQHIFSSLYDLSPDTVSGIFKLKVLELFLYLDHLADEEPQYAQPVPAHYLGTMRHVECFLRENLDENIPLEKLCQRFGLGMTSLKQYFRTLYGCPPATYRKICRMQQAARLLRSTSATITEIAGRSGYENISKFSSAFKSVMGASPTEYRNQGS